MHSDNNDDSTVVDSDLNSSSTSANGDFNHNTNGSSNGHNFDNGSVLNPANARAEYLVDEGRFNDSTTLYDEIDGINQSPSLRKYGLNASMRHLHYSDNKLALDNFINKTIDLLYELTNENKSRPIFYPTNVGTSDERVQLFKSNKSIKSVEKSKQTNESVDIDVDFKVLKLNLPSHNHNDLISGINALDKSSISILLEQKLNQQVKFLLNLKDRIDDTSSRVFVTGDLNAGKSSFCNALLRRKVLPEDQQPCTSVFCEIIDASKENNSIEEVHAIPIDSNYDIKDESTYSVHGLQKLEELVYESHKYSLLKVYLNDVRPKDQSLLCNGVIDIRLIDAPGLNIDSYQTTQVFSRQEEIDLVVFVVNSENYFTLSGKEFISSAASEKQYLFIVSNKFDNIKDKERCRTKILEQVQSLSPETYKNSNEFVHFLSSSEVGTGGDPGDGGEPDNDDENNRRDPNFDHLEASLRKFVLEKRAISKLLPAKNFLLNILNDLITLSNLNKSLYENEKKDLMEELDKKIAPKYDDMLNKSVRINDSILKSIDETCSKAYEFTKLELNDSISKMGDKQIVNYAGIQFAYDYAQETQSRNIESILSAIGLCEGHAKEVTKESVDKIITLGKQTLGDEFLNDKTFQAELMFSRKRDINARNLYTNIEFTDFFDPSIESFFMWIGVPGNVVSSSINQLSYYNPTSIITKLPLTAITLREQLPTQLTLHTLYSSTKILTAGAVVRRLYSLSNILTPKVLKSIAAPLLLTLTGVSIYYLVSDIPNALPRKQARKLKSRIHEIELVHTNSDRISKECRKVLNYPSRQVMNNFQTSIDKRVNEKEKFESKINDAKLSLSYFNGLSEKILHQIELVKNINLENVNVVD
ncbi:mitofusin Fzo1p [[Candida] jaroonii]|uniref:Mitofusin Fzo1p n=1 Tax=[Candida] jaroonii TaxID=467808 RepID=A0ACA9YDG5_9ASCO|nr:mitofusin Fzo1p [[Candida] jaroonii]